MRPHAPQFGCQIGKFLFQDILAVRIDDPVLDLEIENLVLGRLQTTLQLLQALVQPGGITTHEICSRILLVGEIAAGNRIRQPRRLDRIGRRNLDIQHIGLFGALHDNHALQGADGLGEPIIKARHWRRRTEERQQPGAQARCGRHKIGIFRKPLSLRHATQDGIGGDELALALDKCRIGT